MMKTHHGQPRRPNIAVTPDVSTPTPDSPHPRYEVKTSYLDAVLRAGGLPFIAAITDDKSCIEAYLDRVSGLLVTGGAFDIPPELYGETAREGLGQVKLSRSSFELAMVRAALARHMPVLGVCGGMQLINVAYGGTLIQDLSRELPKAQLHEQKNDRTQPSHPVEVKDASILAECVGRGQLMVNSTHHQAVKTVGNGLIATAHAPDGVVEAVEAKGEPYVLGVQWHPELMLDTVPPNLGVYKLFVNRARERRH